MSRGKIVKCHFVKTYNGERGTSYIHTVDFDNGDSGQCFFQKELPVEYAVGTEHDYEYTPNANPQYAGKIKFTTAKSGGGFAGKKAPANNASFSLAYAKDILIASWLKENKADHLSSSQMFTLAEKMYEWLEARKS
jgi:hypothetical protein